MTSANGTILRVENLVKYFPVTAGLLGRVVAHVQAVDGISFDIRKGETLGLVGESGCGKTTAGRTILRLIEPTSGRIIFDGQDITTLGTRALIPFRRRMQVIFQDPFSSLNPRMTVLDIVGESLEVHGVTRARDTERVVVKLLERVGIPKAWVNRYPHEFSGGQRQRIGIARAIALNPDFIVCDEAVSALDVSIQAQVINLLMDLRKELDLSYLFIAHDLSVVKHISNRIAVMYLGQIVETAPAKLLFHEPVHPYTRALLSAIPIPDPTRVRDRIVLEGDVPTPLNPPRGCRFHTRCPAVMDRCRLEEPSVTTVSEGHEVKCFLAEGVGREEGWFERYLENLAKATRATETLRPVVEGPVDRGGRQTAEGRKLEEVAEIPDEPLKVGAWIGKGLAAVGAVLILAGASGLGVVLVILAYFALIPTTKARSGLTVGFATGLFILLLGGLGPAALRKKAEARAQYEGLVEQVRRRTEVVGAYPKSLDELGWRLYEVFPDGRTRDPWGRTWQYRFPGEAGRDFDLGSVGPDGEAGTADDIGFPSAGEPGTGTGTGGAG